MTDTPELTWKPPVGHSKAPVSGVRGERAGGYRFTLTADDRARLHAAARAAGLPTAAFIRAWIRTLPTT
jgi:hypothetical protein